MVALIVRSRVVAPSRELGLDGVEQPPFQDRLVLRLMDLPLVGDFADIEAVAQKVAERPDPKPNAAPNFPGR